MSELHALGDHLWQSTAFASIAALAAFAMRNHYARTRYWLWMAASLKFLVPFSLLVSLGALVPWQAASIDVRSAVTTAVDDLALAPAGLALPASRAGAHSSDWVVPVLLLAWAIGCFIIIMRWLVRWRRVAAIVRAAGPLVEGRELEALRRAGAPQDLRLAISGTSIEPGVFGIARPVLFLPAGFAQHLSDAQLDAILMHELCHVRRRDNLGAAIHMVVEAVFWFHPLVWWLSARLVEERERACDEEVLRLCGNSRAYAEGILRACKFCLQSPLACVSGVTGADLQERIERIIRRPFTRRLGLTGRLLLSGAAATAVALPFLGGIVRVPVARAESPAKPEVFDVVSIKPAPPGQRGRGFVTDPGRMRMLNVALGDIIVAAYGVQPFQIANKDLPKETWEIQATAHSHPSRVLDERYEGMMQAMLADRFRLKLHRESKVLPVYAIEVAPGGPKLTVSEQPGLSTHSTAGHVTATGASMRDLAYYLSRRLVRPAVDATGLKGLYDFKLDWTPDAGEISGEPPDPDKSAEPTGEPSLFTALREQLGLKMSAKKLPVEILVIDHWEKPSEN